MTSASPRSILVVSVGYHIIFNDSIVNNCIIVLCADVYHYNYTPEYKTEIFTQTMKFSVISSPGNYCLRKSELFVLYLALRKHALAIYRKFIGCENVNFHWKKKIDIFSDFCTEHRLWVHVNRLGGSNENPQYIFLSKNKKNMYTPAYPSFDM